MYFNILLDSQEINPSEPKRETDRHKEKVRDEGRGRKNEQIKENMHRIENQAFKIVAVHSK